MDDLLIAAVLPGQYRIVTFDGLAAIYHRRSGQTHIVSEPLPEILLALEDGPLTPEGLLARLSVDAAISVESDPGDELVARISELEAIGLVRRA